MLTSLGLRPLHPVTDVQVPINAGRGRPVAADIGRTSALTGRKETHPWCTQAGQTPEGESLARQEGLSVCYCSQSW
jgi:hypothetical protein